MHSVVKKIENHRSKITNSKAIDKINNYIQQLFKNYNSSEFQQTYYYSNQQKRKIDNIELKDEVTTDQEIIKVLKDYDIYNIFSDTMPLI